MDIDRSFCELISVLRRRVLVKWALRNSRDADAFDGFSTNHDQHARLVQLLIDAHEPAALFDHVVVSRAIDGAVGQTGFDDTAFQAYLVGIENRIASAASVDDALARFISNELEMVSHEHDPHVFLLR